MKKVEIFSLNDEKTNFQWEKSHKGSPGVSFKDLLTYKDNMDVSVRFVKIDPKGEIILHTHKVLEIFCILEGEGEVLLGDKKKLCKKGTCLIASSGVEHRVKNTTNFPIFLLCIFNPPIKD